MFVAYTTSHIAVILQTAIVFFVVPDVVLYITSHITAILQTAGLILRYPPLNFIK
jgi:hypothetical protein